MIVKWTSKYIFYKSRVVVPNKGDFEIITLINKKDVLNDLSSLFDIDKAKLERKSIWYNPRTKRIAITPWSFEGFFKYRGHYVNPNTWVWIGEL